MSERQMVNDTMLIAGAIGIAPALFLMYYSLKNYTYPLVQKPFFDDRKLFLMLAIGMVVGVLMFAIQNMFDIAFILFALLFAVIEELVKLVVLNIPRFQKKLDTAFYGYSFGLGIGSTMAFGAVFATMASFNSAGTALTVFDVIVLGLIAIQFNLLNGATGATIGIGVARGLPFGYFSQATIVHLAFNLIMIGFFSMQSPLNYVAFAAATAVVTYYYYVIHFRTVPKFVVSELKKFESRTKG